MQHELKLNGMWQCYSVGGNETLNLSVYNGVAHLSVFKKGTDSRHPIAKFTWNRPAFDYAIKLCQQMLKAEPNTRRTIISLKNDRGNVEVVGETVFVKDEKKTYGLEIISKSLSTPIRFNFRAPSSFSVDGENMSDELRSTLGFESFIEDLKAIRPYLTTHSIPGAVKGGGKTFGNKGGNGGGSYNNNGGYNKSNNYNNNNSYSRNDNGSVDFFNGSSEEAFG